MKKGILFDLDGTLWDSAEGVAAAWNEALAEMGRPERMDTDYVHSIMGKTMDVIAQETFPGETAAEAIRLMDTCLRRENDYLLQHGGILYAGLEETLRTLKAQGYFLAIVSNCQEGYIEAFLAHHQLGQYIDDTENFGHTGHGKGYNIRLVVERNGLEQALYIGDTQGDYDATMEAGLPFLHAAYGFGAVPEGTPHLAEIQALPERVKAFFPA
ncbi:MAG: HAD family hydrolase [Clostridia bacterium]|nr:HAD family hydrolase [Clostridia bacterium]